MKETVDLFGDRVSDRLDGVDLLSVGSGALDLSVFTEGDLAGGLAGGKVSYEHRTTKDLSLFGEGWAGYGYGDRSGLEYGALGGLRWRF